MSVPTFGSEFLVNSITDFNQKQSSVAALDNGFFVVTYTDDSAAGSDADNTGIYGQIFNAAGAPVGATFLINATTTNDQSDSSVIALSGGRFAVVWVDGSQLPGADGYDIRARVFNADGSVAVAEMVVNSTATNLQIAPAIAELTDGSFVISWTDSSQTGSDTSGQAVRAQHFTSGGVATGSELTVNSTTASDQAESSVTALSGGRFLVVWTDNSQTAGDTDSGAIRGQVFNSDGSPSGAELLINTTTLGNQFNPSVVALGGGFVVTWTDGSGTGTDTSGSSIRGRVYDDSGNPTGTDFVVNTTTNSGQDESTTAALPDGGFVVCWLDNSSATNGSDIRAQVFDADGTPSGAEFLVNTTTTGDQSAPSISVLADGRFIVTWTDGSTTGADTSGLAIRAQIFDPRTAAVAVAGTAIADHYIGTAFADQLMGSDGNDRLIGNDGNDFLNGGNDNDSIFGGNGNDTVYGGEGSDLLYGNSGNDTLSGDLGADTMVGGDGNDSYTVDNTGDIVIETNADAATGGIDIVNSWRGNYTLGANIENGRILAAGTAFLTGNGLANTLVAGAGDNILNGAAGTDTVSYWAATGAVTVNLGVTGAQATGGSGLDWLISIENLTGSTFNDRLSGNAAANRLDGGAGDDTLIGGAGNDTLFGGAGADTMAGGDGNDSYTVDNTGDIVIEGNADAATGGIDIVNSWRGNYTLGANIENGRILAAGTAFLTGNGLANTLVAGAGDNILNGAAGTDTVSYWAATGAVTVNLGVTGAQATGGSGLDWLISIENLTGSNFNDWLSGNAAANRLIGGAGDDTLIGGAGNDALMGGLGSDAFVFDTAIGSGNVDTITDFSVVDDTIWLDNAVMGGLGSAGSMAAGLFEANTAGVAATAGTRIVYDIDDGRLFYDADGNGAGAAVQIAKLGAFLALDANDFLII
ncbi:calcium-binding protein [Frigidibacter sp. SD6-1]|uniref:beta strand repeat-containing protein n=1 Tax=Frigidibacter sp. SD6-1 TaxID=3032581 RepID=UPI0024DFED34|nr:calcium-binding protein [Frigidibacter sp. SD6-1]